MGTRILSARVPVALCPGTNRLMRMHWATRRRLMRELMWSLRVACPGACFGYRDPARVRVRIARCTRTRMDPDNLVASAKHILDALVRLGVIVDDAQVDLRVKWVRHAARVGCVIVHVYEVDP
jgi:hypothetical protein